MTPLASPGLEQWFGTTLEGVGLAALSALAMYVAILVVVRVAGLRSFAEMTAFDFAMTIAVGTIIGSTAISASIKVPHALAALITLFALRFLIAALRTTSGPLSKLFDNEPRLVMAYGEVLEDALRQSLLTKPDLFAKLREANVRNLDEVIAVVVETTGDVSVIHTEDGEIDFDPDLLLGVENVEGRFDEND